MKPLLYLGVRRIYGEPCKVWHILNYVRIAISLYQKRFIFDFKKLC